MTLTIGTTRDFLTAGAVAAMSALTPAAFAGALAGGNDPRRQTVAYEQAFAEFEAAVRPSSETYWHSHNRAVADIYAREKSLHGLGGA